MKRETPMNLMLEVHYAGLELEEYSDSVRDVLAGRSTKSSLSLKQRTDLDEARRYQAYMKHMDVLNDPSRRGYENQANYLEQLKREFDEGWAKLMSKTFEDPDHPGRRHSLPVYTVGENRSRSSVMIR